MFVCGYVCARACGGEFPRQKGVPWVQGRERGPSPSRWNPDCLSSPVGRLENHCVWLGGGGVKFVPKKWTPRLQKKPQAGQGR